MRLDAVIFDLDGVITDTAEVHRGAWSLAFDPFLAAHGQPPFTAADYHRHVDGKPRYDGVRDFLASRGLTLPEGDPTDPPGDATVCALGNRKNAGFLTYLRAQGVRVYPESIALVRQLRAHGVATALVTSSRNGPAVLEAAGITDLFDATLDGADAAAADLAGKPDPATFLAAAERLPVEPARAAVVEDAVAGVEAGRRGRFGLVVGVDRGGQGDALRAAGAHEVVGDLGELDVARLGVAAACDGDEAER